MMQQFLKSLFIIPFFFFTLNSFSQIDGSSGSQEKGKIKAIILNNSKEVKKPEAVDLNGTDGFKKAFEKEKEKLKQQQKEEDLKNKGIVTKAQLNEFRIREMYGKDSIVKVDSPQGNFLTLSKTMTISFRDFGAIDGDIISILHNGIPISKIIVLDYYYKSFQINLDDGDNKIEILAINQGSLGANTAQYKLIDSSGLKIASNYWFLATGAKAIFNITKNIK